MTGACVSLERVFDQSMCKRTVVGISTGLNESIREQVFEMLLQFFQFLWSKPENGCHLGSIACS